MGRKGNEPVGFSCPDINKVIELIESARDMCQYISNNTSDEVFKEYANDSILELDGALKEIEGVRSINETLRDWGNEQYDRAEEYEKDNQDKSFRIETLEEEVKDLETQLEKIEG